MPKSTWKKTQEKFLYFHLFQMCPLAIASASALLSEQTLRKGRQIPLVPKDVRTLLASDVAVAAKSKCGHSVAIPQHSKRPLFILFHSNHSPLSVFYVLFAADPPIIFRR